MPEDRESKTEPPTPKRRSEARSRGQVARSQDLSAAVLLLVALIALRLLGPRFHSELLGGVRFFLGGAGADSTRAADAAALAPIAMLLVARLALPFMAAIMLFAVVTSWLQTGWLFTLDPLKPSLDKLNPINGFKRIFSAQTFVKLAMNLGKLGVVIAVAGHTMSSRMNEIMAAMTIGFSAIVPVTAMLCFDLGIRMVVALLILALLDFAYQRYRHESDLKMSKQEVKDELRSMEGDPLVRKRRREMQLEQSVQRIKGAVPKADVVVTNPTEFAVAIQYDPAKMGAPTVVAKGQDYLAARIREVAIQAGVPLVQRPALARTLYRTVEVGQEVPERLYTAVAEILAYVYELSRKAGGRRRPAFAGGVGG